MRTIKATTISILALGLLAGSAVGVAAQDEPSMDAAEVTGREAPFEEISMPDAEEIGDLLVGDDFAFSFIWDMSDDRLDGERTQTVNWRYHDDSGTNIEVITTELTNDGGSWVGEGRGYGSETAGRPILFTLDGRDGYEGLSAFVLLDRATQDVSGQNLQGIIFPSALPEVPEPYAAE